ncbi:MAG TPA: hypothetical protein VK203_02725 [Nostocaceae cyanobacterium]|nr:hypothetical protein [Nostocaceae cyanobacterium]
MEPDKLIQAFTQVVRDQDFVFSPEAIAAIPDLQTTLAELKTQSLEIYAEAIRKWYLEFEDVRDAVLIEEREIAKGKKTKAENQENIIENRHRVLDDELQKLQDKNKNKLPPQTKP